MRSSRSHIDHENRRNDYHYHSRNQSHSESNGHGTSNSNEYRSSKRTSTSSGNNLIKRMKSSSLTQNEITSVSSKEIVNSKKPTNHSISSLIAVDPNECHQLTYNAYLLEESEALTTEENLYKKSINDFEKFSEVSSGLKKLIKELLEDKKQKCQQQKSDGKINSSKSLDPFSDVKVKGLMYLIEMKNFNRLDKYRLKEARRRINLTKDKVDQIHLQLQNIQYEVMHLQKEQKTCASFRSKDEKLDLVDEQKFLVSDHFPEELKHLLIVSPDKTTISLDKEKATSEELHKLHLARLDWELKQRIFCDNQLKMAEESRFRLESEITSKKRTLSQFDPTLKNIIESTKPLATQLNVPLQVYNSSVSTSFLPQPLYVLYIQLCAYKNAFGLTYEVNILGSPDEAQEFELKYKNFNLLLFNKTDDEDDSGLQIDDDDDESEHRSKSNKFRHHSHLKSEDYSESMITESLSPCTDVKNLPKNDFLRKYSKLLPSHPMKISLMFRYNCYLLTCTFTFFPKLELIGLTYNLENTDNPMETGFSVTNYESNMFSKLLSSSDTGYKCPSSTIEYLLRRNGIVSYSDLVSQTGYTYDWVQRMAGIEYLNPDGKPIFSSSGIIRVKSSVALDCLDKTIQFMNLRFQSRINLQEQLQEISTKKHIDINKFISDDPKERNPIAPKPKSFIKSFLKVTDEEFINRLDFHKKKNLIDYFENEDGDFSNDLFDNDNFIFKMIIKHDLEEADNPPTSYEFQSYIIIPHNYPWRWPFFNLSYISDTANGTFFLYRKWIRSLEEHVNVTLPKKLIREGKGPKVPRYSTVLLLRQVYDLQCGIDVIVEAHRKYLQKANDESKEVYSGPRSVNSFLSTSTVQGHDHSLYFI